MEKRINRGNRYPNGGKCITALKIKEEKLKREQARQRTKSGGLSYVEIEGE